MSVYDIRFSSANEPYICLLVWATDDLMAYRKAIKTLGNRFNRAMVLKHMRVLECGGTF